jgi:CRP/FNR family transcriptional regulator, dissimilatory nitrate respiration regulator
MNIISQLEKASLFRGLSHKHLETLGTIALPKAVPKKKILFWEKEEGHFVYLLCFGLVRLYKTDRNGREIDIKLVKPGEVFGEVILFEQRTYPVSAVAVRECDILLLPRNDILCLLQNSEFRDDFIGMLLKKLRYLTGKIYHLTTGDVRERFFLFLTEHYGEKKEYYIPMTKQDMAKAMGTNPETLSRLIAQLKKEGVLTWEGKKIIMADGLFRGKNT